MIYFGSSFENEKEWSPMETTLAPPSQEKRLRMSYEEFLAWADEDTHAEWVDGEVIIFMPKPRHQDVVTFVVTLLRLFVQFFHLGRVLTAPVEMKPTPTSNSREPDIIFIAQENLARLTEDRLEGPADVVVEVISGSSVARDRSDKFYEYQEAGVREYWLFDPRPGKERADFWVLDADGKYLPIPPDKGDVYRSTVIPGFWLRTAWLWLEEKPDPQLTFAEIVGFPAQVIELLRQLAARGLTNGAATGPQTD
jgi:Uma2 family endonuclease